MQPLQEEAPILIPRAVNEYQVLNPWEGGELYPTTPVLSPGQQAQGVPAGGEESQGYGDYGQGSQEIHEEDGGLGEMSGHQEVELGKRVRKMKRDKDGVNEM